MQISTPNSFRPRQLSKVQSETRTPETPVQAPEPKESVETMGDKAMRIAMGTLKSAATGAIGGYMAQQPGMVSTLGTAWLGLGGLGEGAMVGWNVGSRAGLKIAGGNGEPIAKGIGSLAITFGSPFVGGIGGTVAGIACATAGPLVSAGVFAGMGFIREMAR